MLTIIQTLRIIRVAFFVSFTVGRKTYLKQEVATTYNRTFLTALRSQKT